MTTELDPRRGYRLHPSSLVLNLGGAASKLLLPALFVFVLTRRDGGEFILAAMFVPSAIYEVIRFVTVRYRMEEDEIVVSEGVFTRKQRHIPFHRIQNVDLVQSVFHRLLGVAEVRLETASGSEPEAVLRVLSLRAVAEMRQNIFARRDALDPDEGEEAADDDDAPATRADGRVLVRLGTGELIRLGLISNHGMAVVAAAFGAAWEFDLLERIPDPSEAFPGAEEWLDEHWLAAGLLVVGSVLTLIVLLSIAWSIVRMHRFELRQVGQDLRLSCGLLTRLSATVPIPRIQHLSIHENLLHRAFGRVTLRVETAGSGESEDTNVSRKWLVPLCPRDRVPELVQTLMPGTRVEGLHWRKMTPLGRRRLLRRSLIVATLAAAAVAALFRPWGLLAFALFLPWSALMARREGRYLAWARTTRGMAYRSGAWTRRTSFVPFSRMQVVSVQANPFDRRVGHASLRVDTAGAGPAGHRVRVPYLPDHRAARLGRGLAQRAQSAGFSW